MYENNFVARLNRVKEEARKSEVKMCSRARLGMYLLQ
jgi:hypothetical protein